MALLDLLDESSDPTEAVDDDFCTGCFVDHDPAECGYNPANHDIPV
jgi:hypothetical protein